MARSCAEPGTGGALIDKALYYIHILIYKRWLEKVTDTDLIDPTKVSESKLSLRS